MIGQRHTSGKQIALVKGVKLLKKGITLKKLPSGTYKISVLATTVLKQHLSGSQTYKSCTPGSGTIGLKRVKKKHHHGVHVAPGGGVILAVSWSL